MPIPRRVRPFLPSVAQAVLCLCLPTVAAAQEQERSLRDRIERPNMDLHASGFEKTFTPTTASIDKPVPVHAFGSARAAGIKGDGPFHTGLFGTSRIKTPAFGTKKFSQADRGAVQTDRTYDSKTVDVREDRAANKSVELRNYQSSDQPFISHGKRQDDFDELRRQKQLSIEQVRELLNKSK